MSDLIQWSPGVTLKSIERQVIQRAFAFYQKNKTATAKALGISVRTLDERIKEFELDDEAEKARYEAEKQRRAEFLKRARGERTAQHNSAYTPPQVQPKAESGVRLESALKPTAQQPVPVSERKEVQDVLPRKASAGGNGKSR